MATREPVGPFRRVLLALLERQRDLDDRSRRLAVGVLSFAVAFLLWFTFSMRESYSVTIEMPLEVVRVPEGQALAALPPPVVRVTVQGEGWELLKLQRTPPTLLVNALDEQVDLFAAASEGARLPPGLQVLSVSPSSLRLQLEPEVTRTLPIRLVSDVSAGTDFDLLAPPRFTPDSVQVTGAASIVNALRSFPTQPLVAEDLRQTLTVRVPLSDTLRGLVRRNLSTVEVTVPVALFTEARRELPVRVEGTPPGAPSVVLLPSRVEVTYRVPVEQYERSLRAPDFHAIVSYADVIRDETGTVQPVLQLPGGLVIRDARVEPRRLSYRLRID